MSENNIAIVGSDTAAGKLLLEKLEDYDLKLDQVFPLEKLPEEYASIRFRQKTYLIQKLDDFDFSQVKIVFFMCSKKNIEEYIIKALEAGCYVIDDTGAKIDGYGDLAIIPEINGSQIYEYNARYLKSPHAITIQTILAMQDLINQFGISNLTVTSFEAVSGEGQPAITELANQAISLFNTKPIVNRHFPVQIAFNTIPSLIDFESDEEYSDHEKTILNEIENLIPSLSGQVCINAFHVPVFYGHSALISFSTISPTTVDELKNTLKESSLVDYIDHEVVTPVTHATSKDVPVVTRLRASTANNQEFNLFSVIDNSLKGEVLNCIQIAAKIMEYL